MCRLFVIGTRRFDPPTASPSRSKCRRVEPAPHACSIAQAGRDARRGCSRPSWRSGSVPVGERRAGARGVAGPTGASRTRPSGKCSGARDSRGDRRLLASRRTATSGRARVICWTWTCSRYARFERPGHHTVGIRVLALSKTARSSRAPNIEADLMPPMLGRGVAPEGVNADKPHPDPSTRQGNRDQPPHLVSLRERLTLFRPSSNGPLARAVRRDRGGPRTDSK